MVGEKMERHFLEMAKEGLSHGKKDLSGKFGIDIAVGDANDKSKGQKSNDSDQKDDQKMVILPQKDPVNKDLDKKGLNHTQGCTDDTQD
jgi:hypothetical protein